MRRSYAYILSLGLLLQSISYASDLTFQKFKNFDEIAPTQFTAADVLVIDPRNTIVNRSFDDHKLEFDEFFQRINSLGTPYFFIRHGNGFTGQDLYHYIKSEHNQILRPSDLLDNHPVLRAHSGVMWDLEYSDFIQHLAIIDDLVRKARPGTTRLVFFTQDYDYLNSLRQNPLPFPVEAWFKLMPSEIDTWRAASYALMGEADREWILTEDAPQIARRILRDPSLLIRPFYKPFENGKTLTLYKIISERRLGGVFAQVFSQVNETSDPHLRLAQFVIKDSEPTYEGLYADVLTKLAPFYNPDIWPDLLAAATTLMGPDAEMSREDRLHHTQRLALLAPEDLKKMASLPHAEAIKIFMETGTILPQLHSLSNVFDMVLFSESLKDQPLDYQQTAAWAVEYATDAQSLPYFYEHLKSQARAVSGKPNPQAFDTIVLPILKLVNTKDLLLTRESIFEYFVQLKATLMDLNQWSKKALNCRFDSMQLRYDLPCGIKPDLTTLALNKIFAFINMFIENNNTATYKCHSMARDLIESSIKCQSALDIDVHFEMLNECYRAHPYSDIYDVLSNFSRIPINNLKILHRMFQAINNEGMRGIHTKDLMCLLDDAAKPTEQQMQEIYDRFIRKLEEKKNNPHPPHHVYIAYDITPDFYGCWNAIRGYMQDHKDNL